VEVALKASGIIIAALDSAPDAIEAWNKWYDLDHLPPNVGLPGIMSGRRYVAPAELNALRSGVDGSWWADRNASFLTIYTLCGDIMETFGAMVTLRDELDAGGRMFAENLKTVRGGDGLTLLRATGRAELTNDASELPFLGHAGLVVLRNTDSGRYDDADHDTLAKAVLGPDSGSALLSYQSAVVSGAGLHVLLLDDDVATRTAAIAEALASFGVDGFSQAAYQAIEPHDYSWADGLRAADLPRM
jgi:hypothetical protein